MSCVYHSYEDEVAEIHSLSYLFCSVMSLHSPGHRFGKMPQRAQSRQERHVGIFSQAPQLTRNHHPEITAVQKVKEIRDANQCTLSPSYRALLSSGLRRVTRQRSLTLFLEMVEHAFLGIPNLGIVYLSSQYKYTRGPTHEKCMSRVPRHSLASVARPLPTSDT